MKNINYKIEFFSEWHCGSGLSAGANLDALTIKDNHQLPYVPGKTIKGLVREALSYIVNEECVDSLLGSGNNVSNRSCYFSNAELNQNEKSQIVNDKLQSYLYRAITSTEIDENGIAKDNSLRRIETVVPCVLYGTIENVPKYCAENLASSMSLIKRIGVNRNRGLGRCQITIVSA